MTTTTIIGLALSPAIALSLFLYIYLLEKRKPWMVLLKGFAAGACATPLLFITVFIVKKVGLAGFSDLFDSLFYAFIVAGFSSELGKFIMLKFFIMPAKDIRTPTFAMVASVMASLGFASVVGLIFFLNIFNLNPPYPVNMFLILLGPANVIFGIILGFFIGRAKFDETPIVYNLVGLLSSSFFAGLLSFCLISHDFKLMSLIAFGSSAVVTVLVIKARTN
ncbi:MAG: PrsW family glutamic-type intramembrane protease [Bacteroidota bacterium]